MPCRDNRDQQWLTIGLRAQTKGGFGIGAGVDIAVHSAGHPYGPPLPPYNIVFGISHPLEFGPSRTVTKTVTVEKKVATESPRTRDGFVAGKVISAGGGAPLERAIVAVAGRTKSRVATDPDGSFKTGALPPGPVELEVTAVDFEPTSARAEVLAGQEAAVTVTLTPRARNAKVTGRLTDDKGRGVAGTLRFSGAQNAEVTADESGAFSTQLTAGAYVVRIEAARHFAKEVKVSVESGKDQDLSTQVRGRPAVSRVTVKGGRLLVRSPISFKSAGGKGPPLDPTPTARGVIEELADALISHPEVKRVRIEAHWDNSLAAAAAKDLTEQQARTVAAELARLGVGEERLATAGMGGARPLVPNIGAAKLRNRRVEFRAEN